MVRGKGGRVGQTGPNEQAHACPAASPMQMLELDSYHTGASRIRDGKATIWTSFGTQNVPWNACELGSALIHIENNVE